MQEEPLPKVLHVAFSSRVFPDVDHRDVQIAMELWAKELSRKVGIHQAQVTLFNSPDEIRKMVRSGEIHLVTLPPMEYLAWQRELNIVPAYVAANKSGRDMEYLLIVRRNSGVTKVPDLRGKTLAMPPAAKDQTSSLWLTVLLLREGVRDAHGYLGKMADAGKPSQAILGVFFRQYHAAIVHRGSLETCIAVNPQLGKDLIVLAESKSLIGEISCIPAALGRRMRQAIDTAALTLHETAVGRQMTTLFHIDRVVPFNPSYLAGLEGLLRERERLTAKTAKRK
jgi:phosphonate transport system substrate-binding protein